MTKRILFPGLLAMTLATAIAQVSVEVVTDQDQFLRGESLPLAVRITNRSGQPLTLGSDEQWLTFSVESREGGVIPKLADAPVLGEFVLGSSKVATKRVDIAPYFPIPTSGRYTVTATVRIKAWGMEIESRPKSFDIIEGAKLWEQEFGIPPAPGDEQAPPRVRKYTLQQANYIRGQLRLYLRVLESSGRVVKVNPIGQLLSFSRPEAQVDQFSKLHVLYQDRPHAFSYTVYDPDGELLVRQTYDMTNSRPRLQIDSSTGKIGVSGASRRITHNDIPPPPKEAAVSANAPPATNMPTPAAESPKSTTEKSKKK